MRLSVFWSKVYGWDMEYNVVRILYLVIVSSNLLPRFLDSAFLIIFDELNNLDFSAISKSLHSLALVLYRRASNRISGSDVGADFAPSLSVFAKLVTLDRVDQLNCYRPLSLQKGFGCNSPKVNVVLSASDTYEKLCNEIRTIAT